MTAPTRDQSGTDERVQRYAEVLHEWDPEANGPYVLTEYLAAASAAVIEVADAEQAVLREGLAEVNRDIHDLERALAKERAKVARVEALLEAAESSAREARIREPRRVSIAAVRTELDEQ